MNGNGCSAATRQRQPALWEPIVAFVQDCLVIDGNETVWCSTVHEKLVLWCHKTGNKALLQKAPNPSKLTKQLKKVPGLEKLTTIRKFGESGSRYVGIRLRSKLDDEGWYALGIKTYALNAL